MGTVSGNLGSSSGTTTIHSLTMTNGISINLTNPLVLDSGAIVSGTTTVGSNTITGGSIVFGTNSTTVGSGSTNAWSAGSVTTTEGFIHTLNNLTLNAPIIDTVPTGTSFTPTAVVKDGQGNLTITASQSYSGGTYLNAGTLTLAVGNSGSPTFVNGVNAVAIILHGGTLTTADNNGTVEDVGGRL